MKTEKLEYKLFAEQFIERSAPRGVDVANKRLYGEDYKYLPKEDYITMASPTACGSGDAHWFDDS